MKTSKSKTAPVATASDASGPMYQLRSVTRAAELAAAKAAPKKPRARATSRDLTEDRGARQMKTERPAQTLPHGH